MLRISPSKCGSRCGLAAHVDASNNSCLQYGPRMLVDMHTLLQIVCNALSFDSLADIYEGLFSNPIALDELCMISRTGHALDAEHVHICSSACARLFHLPLVGRMSRDAHSTEVKITRRFDTKHDWLSRHLSPITSTLLTSPCSGCKCGWRNVQLARVLGSSASSSPKMGGSHAPFKHIS